jgi:hypothetical protein
MIVHLKHGIANWEKSGAGDGGHDEGDGFHSDAEEKLMTKIQMKLTSKEPHHQRETRLIMIVQMTRV